jgi:hypothetical protein
LIYRQNKTEPHNENERKMFVNLIAWILFATFSWKILEAYYEQQQLNKSRLYDLENVLCWKD